MDITESLQNFVKLMKEIGVPEELQKDRQWQSALYILLQHPEIKKQAMDYIDFRKAEIDPKLIEWPDWTPFELILIQLALSLYDHNNKFNYEDVPGLAGMKLEDRQMAWVAIGIRIHLLSISIFQREPRSLYEKIQIEDSHRNMFASGSIPLDDF